MAVAIKESKNFRELIVKELVNKFKKSQTIVVSSFSGLKNKELEELRKSLKSASSDYIVVKNTLSKQAVKKVKLDDLADLFEGSVGIAFSGEDAVAFAKSLVKFEKSFESFKIKGGIFEGQTVTVQRLKEIAALPSKELLLAKLVGNLQSPIYGLVFVLKENMRKLAVLLNEINKKKG